MGIVFLIVAGGVLGWLATIMDRAQSLKETPINMLAGTAGSMLAGLVFSPMLGMGSLQNGQYSIGAILFALAGAALALAIAHYLRRLTVR